MKYYYFFLILLILLSIVLSDKTTSKKNLIKFPDNKFYWFNAPELYNHNITNYNFIYNSPSTFVSTKYDEGKDKFILPVFHREKFIDYKNLEFPKYDYDTIKNIYENENLPLPDMSDQLFINEKEDLKLYANMDSFESYGAAYIIHKEFYTYHNRSSYRFNLSMVNCEMASLFYFKNDIFRVKIPEKSNMILQTLDLLDFSVLHLSAYERKVKTHVSLLGKKDSRIKLRNYNINIIKNYKHYYEGIVRDGLEDKSYQYHPKANRTIVVMPFLGHSYGAGHSDLSNRFYYLYSCFWSFYEYYPNIAIFVKLQEDYDWFINESGLPFFEIVLLKDLPKHAALPFATTVEINQRLNRADGVWKDLFDYVFFTESDQLLITRDFNHIYDYLDKYRRHIITPHRLYPFHTELISKLYNRDISQTQDTNHWMNLSCCLPRYNHLNRTRWIQPNSEFPYINFYHSIVPMGAGNFLGEFFNFCSLSPRVKYVCP